MPSLNLLQGYKTYAVAIGLVGLSVYQLSTGLYDPAAQSLLAAATAAGLRSAISKSNA